MEGTRQRQFSKYADSLFSEDSNYSTIGRKLWYVRWFLENTESVSERGLQNLMKKKADEIMGKGGADTGLRVIKDFLICMKKTTVPSGAANTVESLVPIEERTKTNIAKANAFMIWLEKECDLSSCTVRLYYTTLKQYFTYAQDFSLDNCKRFIKTLEDKGYSPKSISTKMSALEKYGEYVKVQIKMRRPKIQRTLNVENVPSLDDYRKLTEYLKKKNYLYYLWVRILATTGARVSEFVQIRWSDILAGEKVMRGKGNKYRRFFFQKDLMEEARNYIAAGDLSGYVATNKYGGVITTKGLAFLMHSWAEKTGVDKKKVHPHAFRHFFAKMFLRSNKDIVQLADLMGHGSIETTRIYLQRSYEEQKRDFDRNVNW